MNKRIREIAKQAYAEVSKTTPSFLVTNEMWQEKFAELIVQECMMLVEGFETTQEVALDEYVDYEASDVLKEHFGVEE